MTKIEFYKKMKPLEDKLMSKGVKSLAIDYHSDYQDIDECRVVAEDYLNMTIDNKGLVFILDDGDFVIFLDKDDEDHEGYVVKTIEKAIEVILG